MGRRCADGHGVASPSTFRARGAATTRFRAARDCTRQASPFNQPLRRTSYKNAMSDCAPP